MFSRSSVRTRTSRLALLLAFLIVSTDAAADSGDYRVRDKTLSGGMQIVQRVDTTVFPQFQGERPKPSSDDAPGVDVNHLRAVRALLPRKSDDAFALALPDGTPNFSIRVYNHHVVVEYGAASVGPYSSPFANADRQAIWNDTTRRWSQVIAIGKRLSATATHFLVTLYVVPRFDGASPRERTPNLVVTVNEATVQGMNVVRGRSLADNVLLAVDENDWSLWGRKPLRMGLTRDADSGPLTPPAAFTSRLPFVEQRTIDLRSESTMRRRDKRCLSDVAYTISNLLLPALLELYFGRSDLCSLDPHPDQDIAGALPLVEVAHREDVPRVVESTVFEAAVREPSEFGASTAFDAAMDIQFCNAGHARAARDEACNDGDRRAIAMIGDLTPLQITELLARIARMFEPDQPGTGTLRTGNDELDQWLNADLVRAENALNAAQAVVHVSDARAEPKKPVKNKKKKRKLVKASCTETMARDPSSADPFQECVRRAKRRIGETEPIVALTPHVVNNERYHARGTPQFDRLARQFINLGRGMPWGLSEAQFAKFTAAIARDRAPTGDNLGFVFINDPTLRNGPERFRYGVEHIWAAGAGGGDTAGHRDDWQALRGLSVRGRDMLIQLIMAALTDPNARFTQTRTSNGNVVRTFEYFMFMHGSTPFAIRNVRIVLGQNGMVVTAYPLRNASAEPLEM